LRTGEEKREKKGKIAKKKGEKSMGREPRLDLRGKERTGEEKERKGEYQKERGEEHGKGAEIGVDMDRENRGRIAREKAE
jgi:hypothetical protein